MGHGGSIEGSLLHFSHAYNLSYQMLGHDWNCCLSAFEVIGTACRAIRIHDVSHIPAYRITANNVYMAKQD